MQFDIKGDIISVNMPSRDALISAITSRLQEGRGFAVATLNVDHLVKLRSDAFRYAYLAQDLVTADGNPIVWMSWLGGSPVDLVTGSDVILPLARLAAQEHVRIGLFGSDDATLDLARAALIAEIPDIDVGLTIAPPMGFAPTGRDADAAIEAFATAGVGMIFVALGAPKQEMFAAHGRLLAPGIGFVSIGAGLDFIAGKQRRAPLWMRKWALEWLWRMMSDPKRLIRRYAQCFLVLPRHVIGSLALRAGSAKVEQQKDGSRQTRH